MGIPCTSSGESLSAQSRATYSSAEGYVGHPLLTVPGQHPLRLLSPVPRCPSEVLLLSQGEEHCLGRVLEEGSSVLLLPFLHPVAVDTESVGVDEPPQRPEGVGVSDDDLPGYRLHPTVLVVDPY